MFNVRAPGAVQHLVNPTLDPPAALAASEDPPMRSSRSFPLATACGLLLALTLAAVEVRAGTHTHSQFSMGAGAEDGDWLMSGTWSGGRDDHPGRLYLQFECRTDDGNSRSSWGRVETGQIEGLDLRSPGAGRTPVDFRVKRDAGSIRLHGDWSGTHGGGTFDVELDPKYADELARRGVGRPTAAQQARLLLGGADLALLDALAKEHYATPRVTLLIRMTDHGVRAETVTAYAKAGYRLESLDALVTAVDHGVNPQFIAEMASAGYKDLAFETLLRARDHGADASFVEDLADAGFQRLPLEIVIRARDHGVDGGYVQSLRRAGFEKLTLEDAIRARDHGVTSGYAKRMREKQPNASLDEVIAWRDRGVR